MNTELIKKEIIYKAVRSSGPGGQNVNKVATKVILYFNLKNSNAFNLEQKERLLEKFADKITTDGDLLISSSESRSQLKNKEIALAKLFTILQAALKVKLKRIATKIPKGVIKKRLEDKKNQSLKKDLRKNIKM